MTKLSGLLVAPVLVAGTTVGLAATSAAPASAACAPGLSVAKVTSSAAGKPRVSAAKAAVVKKSKTKYAASSTVKATFGKATATVRDTFCSGDAAARTLTWDYPASGVGTFTKSVTATGSSKAKAKAALAKKVSSAKKSLATKAKKQGKAAAVAQATRAARAKATGLSHVVYLSTVREGVYATSKTAGAGMLRLSQTSTGVTNLVIPAGYDDTTMTCITKASTWPASAYLVDAGYHIEGTVLTGTPAVTVNNQAALDAAVVGGAAPTIGALSVSLAEGAFSFAGSSPFAAVLQWSDNGSGIATLDGYAMQLVSGSLVCFGTTDMPAGTVSIHGLRVAANLKQVGGDESTAILGAVSPLKVRIG